MRQYVLTRSAYGPAWDQRANARRLAITRAVTARLMTAQTQTDWTWIVLLDERDPHLADRLALYGSSAPSFVPLVWMPPAYPPRERLLRQRIAAADYRAPWRSLIPADDTVVMSRIDDDDGFAPDALARFRAAAAGITKRTALMLPAGVWVYRRAWCDVRHERNAMHALVTPPGDTGCIYDYSHVKVATAAPVVMVDDAWGWIWTRHIDTISSRGVPRNFTKVRPSRLTAAVRSAFPIDWHVVERVL